MSAVEQPTAPGPDAPEPAREPEPERHCRRCGSRLGPRQEWCLACGAATTTHVAPPRGWRVPLFAGGGLLVLLVAAIILALVALSKGPEQVAEATPTPTPLAEVPPATTPVPTATPLPTVTPSTSATPAPTSTGGGAGIASWPAGRSAWTIVLESAKDRAQARSVAKDLQAQGVSVGILRSDDYPSLNPGYYVVFSGQYDTRKAAEQAQSSLPAAAKSGYVRKVSPS